MSKWPVTATQPPTGRETVDDAEPEVAERREALEIRIDDHRDDHDRREPARDRRQLRDADDEDGERRQRERDHLRALEAPGRQLAPCRARVASVDGRVHEAVDGHRERARADHRRP